MKVIAISKPGSSEVLQPAYREIPIVGPGELLVKVKAAGINRPDILQREGKYPAPKGVPADIPGLEISGVVEKSGVDTTRFIPGDKICALLAGGGYAEYVVVPEGQCLPLPRGLTFEEAASLPETYFTVWTNVFDRGRFQKGEKFLVHGGTSGIGVAAIQLVKAFGGKVYTTAGTSEKCLFAEKLGAVKAIHYREEDFEEALKNLEPEGIDIILDMVGGDYTAKNINLLRSEGRLVIINAMKNRTADIDLLKVMVKRITLTGSTLRPRGTAFKHDIAVKLEKYVWPLLESGEIKPVVFKVFPLEEVSLAHEMMESTLHMGKIVLRVGD